MNAVELDANDGYLALIRLSRARRLLYGIAAGSLTLGMTSLTVLLTVRDSTNSFTWSGDAVATAALAMSLTAPAKGRLIDSRPAGRGLILLAIAYAAAMVGLVISARARLPGFGLVVLAAAAGSTWPPFFASARSLWPRAIDPQLIRRAYALTSLLLEVGQVAGPVLTALLFLTSSLLAPLICAAMALLASVLAAKLSPARPAVAAIERSKLRGNHRLLRVLALAVAVGFSLGVVQVAVPTRASTWHVGSLAGLFLGVFAVGSIGGAIWTGSRNWKRRPMYRFLIGVVLLGLALLLPAAADSPSLLAPALFVAGLALGTTEVTIYETLDDVAPTAGTEDFAWLVSAQGLGTAAGAGAAGFISTRAGASAPFAVASAVTAAPVLLMLAFSTISKTPISAYFVRNKSGG